jgi:hypothetical protein
VPIEEEEEEEEEEGYNSTIITLIRDTRRSTYAFN